MSRHSRAPGSGSLRAFCSSRRAAATLSLLALVFAAPAVVRPAQAQDEATHGTLPAKNGHTFVPTAFIPDAFVNTQLMLSMGLESSIATDVPVLGSGGEQVATIEGDMTFLSGGFEFSCALREWIGFYGRFDALARTGSNTASLLASGFSAASGFSLGWEFRLLDYASSVLSASVDVQQPQITFVDIASGVSSDSLTAVQNYKPLVVNGTARFAHGFNDLVGLSAFAAVGCGETPPDNLENDWFWRLGAVASFNLAQRYDLPLGFTLGARTSSYPQTLDQADGNSFAGLFSIAYMGRPDFTLTLDMQYERVPLVYEDVTMGYFGGTVGLRYWF